MKKIILSVTSDLVTDQRVHKVALSLHNAGYDVLLFGRKKRSSQNLTLRAYKTRRTTLIFEKGFLFYLSYNIRLFFFLLFHKSDILIANDLDTLLPNYLISLLFKKRLIYDTHEYFTGVPELLERPFVRKVWKKLEDYILPRLNTVYTVNDSIAKLYAEEYSIRIHTIRNLPLPYDDTYLRETQDSFGVLPASHSEVAVITNLIYEFLKTEKRSIIIYQGALNKDRGIEEMIAAMEHIENACFLIIGSGDLYKPLRSVIKELDYAEKIMLIGPIPFQYLPAFTRLASLGISLEKATNINYRYASPNKVVDYIHAGVPVLASKLTEIENIVSKYEVGTFIENHQPEIITRVVNSILSNIAQLTQWKINCTKASSGLSWADEEKKLLALVA